ncbi:hypothetical protein OIU77_010103 [Salix suchowensis]|uniref:Uncharacterized protein n=1 Tax=Salix suchowensis TaxID=1278906 RepID=A0ABQ9A752_9ROSI|nr:hypothetical protein OIU78_015914 [Salix suchowensis]KAJ6328344.1 hypothetical protein OIU77_010103 [Salix suchowensis]
MAASSSDETSQRPVVLVRMIHFGIEVGVAMKVMAFWIWLETQGFREIMRKILLHDDRFLTLVAKEAEDILSFLKQLSTNPIPPELMRFTPKLARHFLSLSIILADKEKALKGITDIYNGVCCVFLKDILERMGKKITEDNFFGPLPEVKKSGSEKDGVAAKPIAPYVGSKLSPSAKEWNPLTERAAEENRCLFLTFSNGYPLTEIQISRFFRMNYGSCVERVYVHRPEPKDQNLPPLFGKVIFTASYIPAMILDGKTEAKFWVDAKPLWGKRFEPKKKSGNK